MTVINKSVFCRNLDGARLLGHPVYESNMWPYLTTGKRLKKDNTTKESF